MKFNLNPLLYNEDFSDYDNFFHLPKLKKLQDPLTFLPDITYNNVSTTLKSIHHTGAEDYYYEYDYDESISKVNLVEVLPVAIVYTLTFLVGLVGNVLVIFSVTKFHKMRNVTNIFLTSLASADLLLILICVPIKLIAFMSFTWKLGAFLCKFVYYMQNVSVVCSVLTLTSMSLERYYAIKYPLKAKIFSTLSQAKLVITIVWIVSFILATPILFGRQHIEVGVVRKGYWCVQNWSKKSYSIAYEVFQLSLLLILPVMVMLFAYCSIAQELRSVRLHKLSLQHSNGSTSKSSVVGQLNKKSTSDEKQVHKQVILMLVVILCIYIVCWSPILINNVLAAVGLIPELHIGHWKYVRQAFYVTSYFNSCINPIVYAFVSKNFRESFKISVLACFRGKASARRHVYSKRYSWSSRHQNTFQTNSRSSTHRNCYTNEKVMGTNKTKPMVQYSEELKGDIGKFTSGYNTLKIPTIRRESEETALILINKKTGISSFDKEENANFCKENKDYDQKFNLIYNDEVVGQSNYSYV